MYSIIGQACRRRAPYKDRREISQRGTCNLKSTKFESFIHGHHFPSFIPKSTRRFALSNTADSFAPTATFLVEGSDDVVGLEHWITQPVVTLLVFRKIFSKAIRHRDLNDVRRAAENKLCRYISIPLAHHKPRHVPSAPAIYLFFKLLLL